MDKLMNWGEVLQQLLDLEYKDSNSIQYLTEGNFHFPISVYNHFEFIQYFIVIPIFVSFFTGIALLDSDLIHFWSTPWLPIVFVFLHPPVFQNLWSDCYSKSV